MILTQEGEWYLTYHAYELSHYSLGRQMCLEPVIWTDDGWWRPKHGRAPSERNPVPIAGRAACRLADSDDFDSEALGKQWFFHTRPDKSGRTWSLAEAPGRLRIRTQEGDIGSPRVATNLFLQRVTHKRFDITTTVTFDARDGNEAAGLHLYHDPARSIWLTTTVADGRKVFEAGTRDRPFPLDVDPAGLGPREIVEALRSAPRAKTILARTDNDIGNTVSLKMSIDGHERVSFYFGRDGKRWSAMGPEVYFGDSWHHSRRGREPGRPDLGWVGCGRANVWTGTVMGVFACRDGAARSKNADFHHFHVLPDPEPSGRSG